MLLGSSIKQSCLRLLSVFKRVGLSDVFSLNTFLKIIVVHFNNGN